MSTERSPDPGTIVWTDLTIPNAEEVRDFYHEVVGWRPEPVDMGDYVDFNMLSPAGGQPAAGVCHARGTNADLPPQWLVYVTVADAEQSAARCRELGGKVLVGPRSMGGGTLCVIEDPAGAVLALFQP